jgi:hypothetical protein
VKKVYFEQSGTPVLKRPHFLNVFRDVARPEKGGGSRELKWLYICCKRAICRVGGIVVYRAFQRGGKRGNLPQGPSLRGGPKFEKFEKIISYVSFEKSNDMRKNFLNRNFEP